MPKIGQYIVFYISKQLIQHIGSYPCQYDEERLCHLLVNIRSLIRIIFKLIIVSIIIVLISIKIIIIIVYKAQLCHLV